MKNIGLYAFYGCNLTSIALGPNLSSIGNYSFANNSNLAELVIPNFVTNITIPERMFSGSRLANIYISSSVSGIKTRAFDCSTITSGTVNIWFNGPLSSTTIEEEAFVFAGTTSVNVYANTTSEAAVNDMVSSNKISGVSGVTYIQKDFVTVGFRITGTTPLYTTITALYGSKIVLPYHGNGSVYGSVSYAVVDNDSVYLSVFASEADYSVKRIAQSGDIVSVYPLEDDDRITMQGSADTTSFVHDMTIVTDSDGLDVTITSQTVHYGGLIIVPQFRNSDLIRTNSITLHKSDGTKSYSLALDTVSVYAGINMDLIVLGYEDVMIDVTFISKGVTQIASVKLRAPFALPAELSYMEEPPAGYEFFGWWDAPGNIDGTGGIRAIVGLTPFDFNEVWYAHFRPLDYTLSLKNTSGSPEYTDSVTVSGPYSLHVVGKTLYYTDARHDTNQLLFDANTIPGWSVANYEDNSGRSITGDTAPAIGDSTVFLRMEMNNYELTLRFYSGGSELPASETFIIDGWAIGEGNQFHSGSVISGVSYTYIENGLDMPVPINQTYAFNNMVAGTTTIPSVDGKYTLILDYFNGQLSITIRYNMDTGVYTVQFAMNDDISTIATAGPYTIGESFWLMAADYYTKTGYVFSHYTISGSPSEYPDRQDVVITDAMAASANYCLIKVNAVWSPVTYTVSFDLTPYEGTVPTREVHLVEGEQVFVPLPDVSANHGYKAVSWYWTKAGTSSATFTEPPEFTSDIIREYADGLNLTIGVNWELKTYKANVAGYPTFPEITDIKLGDTITLWDNTLTRQYKEFGGWAIGDNVYMPGDRIFDLIMAEAGDGNGDVVSFTMNWVDIHYQVQYNPEGGSGHVPIDENAYVVRDPFHVAPVDESEFYRYGYSFVGWKYSLDDDVIYEDTGYFEEELALSTTTHTVNFYAVWAQKSYKINYELEGGRYGPSAPTNVRYGDAVVIDNPTRVGYRFEGWTATGLTSGALYYSKSNLFMHWNGSMVDSTIFRDLTDRSTDRTTASVTLTAHWAEASYSTEYLPNGGTWTSISSSQNEISIGDIIELPVLRDPKKTGYTFAGWGIDTINAIPVGTRLTEAMINDPSKFTLYAIWAPAVYQLQYRYTPDYQYSTINADYGASVFVPILDRAGYTFRGWSIVGAGIEAEYSRDNVEWYKLGSSLVNGSYFRNMSSSSGTVTMDAEWEPVEYRLAYNTNGGTGKAPVDSNVYKVGDPVTMKDYKDLEGTNGSKIIIGWSLEINGSAVNVTEFTQGLCTVADATNTVNLYGVWVNDMCTVVVDLSGSTVSTTPAGWVLNSDGTYEKLVTYGSSTKDALSDWDDCTPSKDGYNFSGWEYDTSTVMSSVTAYPVFEKVNMNIIYIFGGVIILFVAVAAIVARP